LNKFISSTAVYQESPAEHLCFVIHYNAEYKPLEQNLERNNINSDRL